jgi:hypothetical protein
MSRGLVATLAAVRKLLMADMGVAQRLADTPAQGVAASPTPEQAISACGSEPEDGNARQSRPSATARATAVVRLGASNLRSK